MKRFFASLLFLLFFCGTAFGQTQLLGVSSAGSQTGGVANDYFQANAFVASVSGMIDQFKIYFTSFTNAKAAIYTNGSGIPGTQVWVNNTGQACSPGWNIITVSPGVSVVAGTTYWLGHNSDNAGRWVNFEYSGGTRVYKPADYASVGCPTDMSGLSSDAILLSMQGWGTASSWTGKVMGKTNPATVMGISVTNIKTVMGK